MCLLIVLRGFHASHPVLVGANRDERKDRRASPPGLWEGERHRMLSPRDRRAGGTWLAIDECGRFAGITNLRGAPTFAGAPSRGHLAHLALDREDLDAAADAVEARVAETPHSGFQLALCDGERTIVLRNDGRGLRRIDWGAEVLVLSDEHGPGELEPRGLREATRRCETVDSQLEALRPLLRDRGGEGHHPICKHGELRGTVSSSLIAVPRDDPGTLVWRYASGPPDQKPYRDYGGFGRRLRTGR